MQSPRSFDFELNDDGLIIVDKTKLIQAFYAEFKVALGENDIKMVDDGLRLLVQFGPMNKSITALKFKQMVDYLSTGTPVLDDITYDEETLKMWLQASSNYLFVEEGDPKLNVVAGGVDAPTGTIQVSTDENKVYTLLYANFEKIDEAINECLKLVGKQISTKPMTFSRQVDDHRVSIIRKKYGKTDKSYNDRVAFKKHPIVTKIIVHA